MERNIDTSSVIRNVVKKFDNEDVAQDFVDRLHPDDMEIEVCPLCFDPKCEHDCLHEELLGESMQEDLHEYNNSVFFEE